MFRYRVIFNEKCVHKGSLNPFLPLVLLCILTFAISNNALAQDDECELSLSYDSEADRLCVPGIETEEGYVIDGDRGEWQPGNYYVFSNYSGVGNAVQAFVSHKKTGFNEADLFLFFEVLADDPVGTFNDEIRIGLNPGVMPDDNTMIKVRPFPMGGGGPQIEVFDYNSGTNTWVPSGAAWLPAGNVAVSEDPTTESWSVEMRIPLHMATNPITGNEFRLYMELIADDGTTPITYAWPPHYPPGLLNNICVNPNRWHPMSFGTACFPDLHIANGLYSCDAIYVWRNGMKSREIAVNQMNEFHADVSGDGDPAKDATDVQVYLTLLKLGISNAPIAMNYDNADAGIKNWFQEKYGTWLLATDQLDTGTPKPPNLFNVNGGSVNTAARFNWNPSDETRFGTPAQMVGNHKCTGAFVDFKNDPNFENNFSYCNTTIVNCPAGEVCALIFWLGPFFAYAHPSGEFSEMLQISAINEPYSGWFKQTTFRIKGEDVKPVSRTAFQVQVPRRGEKQLALEIAVPPMRDQDSSNNVESEPQDKSNINAVKQREEKLRKIYDNLPIILVEGHVPYAFKTGADQDRVRLYRVTSYAAFALNLEKEPITPPVPVPSACGKRSGGSLALLLGTAVGIIFIKNRLRRKINSTPSDSN